MTAPARGEAMEQAKVLVEAIVREMGRNNVGPTKDWNEHVLKRRANAERVALAALKQARREERKACVKATEGITADDRWHDDFKLGYWHARRLIAAALRERGKE